MKRKSSFPRIALHLLLSLLVPLSGAALEPVPVPELSAAIASDRLKVTEFREIEKLARARGLRVFLFGGTAAGLAHYIKANLLIEKGSVELGKQALDFEYTHIYRHNQDLDLVIARQDGAPETQQEISEFQNAVMEKFPYGSGDKTEWEVRGLRTNYRGKDVLLDNPNFLNQHTDSNSTGMIELTEPSSGTAIVRDLREMEASEPHFLKDVASSFLHYYHSPLHGTTERAQQGLNPPILSAIRYLTKAFQYDLKIDPGSIVHLKQVIRDFDPKTVEGRSYVGKWIEKNAKKLVQNATDLELAWNTLEDLGLRKKLIAIRGDTVKTDSMAWWLSKEPLRSHPHPGAFAYPAAAPGRSAGELGITHVTHATKSFTAYEAIARSLLGKPNLLVSRTGTAGESASEGSGTYTLLGLKPPAFLPGYTVRFKVDPLAREGVDFTRTGNFIIWRTANRLKVIPEPFTGLSPLETFQYLVNPDNSGEKATKFRMIRSASKVQPDEAMLAEMRRSIDALVAAGDWNALSEARLYPPARELIVESLQRAQIDLKRITLGVRASAGPSVVPLRDLGMLFVKDSEGFLALFQTANGDTSQRIMQGIQFLDALDVAIRFTPPPGIKELRAIADSWFYNATHWNVLMNKALPLVKSPADYLDLVRNNWDRTKPVTSNVFGLFIRGSIDDFLKLNPTAKELNSLFDYVDTSEVVVALARSRKLGSLGGVQKFLAHTPFSIQKNHVLADQFDGFLALKPDVSAIREYLQQAGAENKSLLQMEEKALLAASSAADFLALSPLTFESTTSAEYISGHAELLKKTFGHFRSLEPSIDDYLRFSKALSQSVEKNRVLAEYLDGFLSRRPDAGAVREYLQQAGAETASLLQMEEKALLATRVPADFVALSAQTFESTTSAPYINGHRELVKRARDHFQSLGPKAEDYLQFSKTMIQSLEKNAVLSEYLGGFLSLKPEGAVVREYLKQAGGETTSLIQMEERALRASGTARSFAELAVLTFDPSTDQYKNNHVALVKKVGSLFEGLAPTVEDYLYFSKALPQSAEKNKILEDRLDGFLSRKPDPANIREFLKQAGGESQSLVRMEEKVLLAARTPEEFLALSQATFEPSNPAYKALHDKMVLAQRARFRILSPADAEIPVPVAVEPETVRVVVPGVGDPPEKARRRSCMRGFRNLFR